MNQLPQASDDRRRLRHGLYAGQLPAGCSTIRQSVARLRQALEDAVLAAKADVTIGDAALIQSACRWETHAQLSRRWLVAEAGKLDAGQRLAYSKAIADASSNRDKCIDRLGLRHAAASIYDAIYATAANNGV